MSFGEGASGISENVALTQREVGRSDNNEAEGVSHPDASRAGRIGSMVMYGSIGEDVRPLGIVPRFIPRKRKLPASRLFRRGGENLSPSVDPFERQINRAFTDGPCAMTNTSVHSNHVPRQEFDRSIIKVNEESAFQRKKALIGIRMTVPGVSLSHGTYSNFMIIDPCNWVIIVAFRPC
jgi:hypothetical protein